MINKIKSETTLVNFIENPRNCEVNDKYNYLGENDVNILIDKDISNEKIVALKIDNYYNSLHLSETPKSVDFLITLNEEKHIYTIYIIELKNIKKMKYVKRHDITEKFQTTIDDFMKVRFSDIFMDNKFKIELKLFFISDPLKLQNKALGEKEVHNRISGTRLELLSQIRPFKFRNKTYQITYKIPHPLITLKKLTSSKNK